MAWQYLKGKINFIPYGRKFHSAAPFELRVQRLAKKAAQGVDFIQTQCIFNIDKFE
jgi:5,10-methylenetetrahydrofolate reductase